MSADSIRYRDRACPIERASTAEAPVDVQKPIEMSEAASKFWDLHADRLKEEGLLILATASRFEDLCRIYEQLRLLEDQLRDEGMVIESNGRQVTNPALKAFCDLEKIVSSLAREFGLTPMARARMNLPRATRKERTALDDFLDGLP